jgi:hypothetical protein
MWTTIVLLVLAGWIIVSTVLDASQRRKSAILEDMRDSYTKKEALDLVYAAKHRTVVQYLAYGFLLGALFASMYRK